MVIKQPLILHKSAYSFSNEFLKGEAADTGISIKLVSNIELK